MTAAEPSCHFRCFDMAVGGLREKPHCLGATGIPQGLQGELGLNGVIMDVACWFSGDVQLLEPSRLNATSSVKYWFSSV